jgi:MFS family permease
MAMTCGSVGALLGPVLMGPLSSWLGIRTPFVLLAAVALVLTVLAAWPADVRCLCCVAWHSCHKSARKWLDEMPRAAMIAVGTPHVRVPTTFPMEVAWI